MKSGSDRSGEALLALCTLLAIQLADGKTAEEAAVLAAFFTTLGDGIALIAARRTAGEPS